MTDTVVEQMARAIWERGHGYIALFPPFQEQAWNDVSPNVKEIHMSLARAALQALEEPTPEMKLAGQEAAFFEPLDNMVAGIDEPEAAVWRAMIRRALEG